VRSTCIQLAQGTAAPDYRNSDTTSADSYEFHKSKSVVPSFTIMPINLALLDLKWLSFEPVINLAVSSISLFLQMPSAC
jgi:hypothetical protein